MGERGAPLSDGEGCRRRRVETHIEIMRAVHTSSLYAQSLPLLYMSRKK